MTDNFKELDGVGEAREEKLNDAGYEEYVDLAEANPDELSDEVNRLPDDKALDLVVQAQNMVDLEEAEVEEGDEEEDDVSEAEFDLEEEDAEADAEAEEEPEPPEEAELYEVVLDFDGEYEYDTFYHTLIEERCNLRRTNRTGIDTYEKMLQSMRDIAVDGQFTVELTEGELNDLHNAVKEQRYDYQGENLIDYMDSLRVVENNINAIREEFLF